MHTYLVPRSGNVPLRFEGDCLALSEGRFRSGQEHIRWHDLALYSVGGTHYVLHIAYRTTSSGEEDNDTAVVFDDLAILVRGLRDYVPERDVVGYPPGEAYRRKQERLKQDVRRRWSNQLAELLASAEFAEVVK